jgi:hypothetical protein
MFKIWEQKTSDNKDYNPNFPIDRDLGFKWRQYLFADAAVPTSTLSFKINEDILNCDYFEGEFIPIVSKKIKSILAEEVPRLVDFHAVEIVGKREDVDFNEFFILKITNEVECFDWENSDYNTRLLKNNVKRISAIRNLVLLEDKIKNQVIFKVAETNYFLACVREDLCMKIINSGATGIEFKDFSEIIR